MLAGKTVAGCKVEREKCNQGERSSTKEILDISLDGTAHARQNTITICSLSICNAIWLSLFAWPRTIMDWNQDGYTFCTEIRCSLVKSHVSIRDNIQSIINLRGTEARYYSDITYGRWVAVCSTIAREENSKENDRRNAYLVPVCLVGLLRKSRYPEDFGSLQKTAKGTLMHVHFPVIDELHQSVQVAERYVLKYYHRVFTRCALQKGKQGGKEETFSCNSYRYVAWDDSWDVLHYQAAYGPCTVIPNLNKPKGSP